MRRPIALSLTITAFAVAVLAAYAGWNVYVLAGALIAAAVLAWTLPVRIGVPAYLATLAIQLPHSTGLVFRPAIADLCLLPAMVRIIVKEPRALWPRSSLRGPFILLAIAFLIAAWIGYLRVGRLTSYVLFNKSLGAGFLMGGALALTHVIRTTEDLLRMVRWFIIGTSIINALVLVAVPLGLTVWPNEIYIAGSYRLFGTMLNPTAYGGVVMTAALLEMALLMRAGTPLRWASLRWVSVWLLGLSVALTLSRSAWLSAGVAAGTLLLLQIVQRPPRLRARPLFWVTGTVMTMLPALAMGAILYANRHQQLLKPPSERAAELHAYLVDACGQQNLPDCEDVQGSPQQQATAKTPAGSPGPTRAAAPGTAGRTTPGKTSPSRTAPPPAAPAPVPAAPPAPDVSVTMRLDGPLMNARGFQDRFAIIGVAWKDYARSRTSMLTGIGLGTFLETSEDDFGVRLIIHNTFAWFLVELGPLGLAALLWLLGVTVSSLWRAWRAGGIHRQLASGALASVAGMLVFFVFNEGFYQRHFWLIFVVADRLRYLAVAADDVTAVA